MLSSWTVSPPVTVPVAPPRHMLRDVMDTAAADLPVNSSATFPAVFNICCDTVGTDWQVVSVYTSCTPSAPGRSRTTRKNATAQLSRPPRRTARPNTAVMRANAKYIMTWITEASEQVWARRTMCLKTRTVKGA